MESDIRYYRRRANEEMIAASRAVTDAARRRRLQLVDLYVQRLQALDEPSPFSRAPEHGEAVAQRSLAMAE